MSGPPKVAIIGGGPIGRSHLAALRELGAEVVGLCTRQEDEGVALAREWGIGYYSTSIRELYAATSAQAVVVAVPVTESPQVYREVFGLPWISLVEKPLGIDLDDARELVSQARLTGHRGFVGFNRRHLAATRTALSRIGQISGNRFVHVKDQQDRNSARAFGHPEPVVRNFMYANSIHLVDYFRLFGRGEITEVRPHIPWTGNFGSSVVVELIFESGDRGVYEGVWERPGPWSVTVQAGAKTLRMEPLERLLELDSAAEISDPPDYRDDELFKPGFLQQSTEFLRALSGSTNCPDLEEALRTTQLVAQIYGHA